MLFDGERSTEFKKLTEWESAGKAPEASWASAEALDVDVLSACGPVREENQDATLAWRAESGEAFAVVSDGMGGHASGRVAAEIVVRACADSVRQRNGRSWREVLSAAITSAHEQVRVALSVYQGGATVVLAAIDLERDLPCLNLAHVGDSRAYLRRGNSIYRLTHDHSLIGQMVRDGYLTEEEAFGHPDSNILQRAIGQSAPLEPEIHEPIPLDFGDMVILCSDGLHGVVKDIDILRVTRRVSSCRGVCRDLLQAALDAKSEDNISIACLRLPESKIKPRPTRPNA